MPDDTDTDPVAIAMQVQVASIERFNSLIMDIWRCMERHGTNSLPDLWELVGDYANSADCVDDEGVALSERAARSIGHPRWAEIADA